jgi:hypothetical protein
MGWLSGFTQDPYAIGDESGMRAMEAMQPMRRFPQRRRQRFTGHHPEGWMGSQDSVVEMAPPREMSAMRTDSPAPVESAQRFPAFQRFKSTLDEMPQREEASVGRRLAGAALAGLAEYGRRGSGREVGENVIEGPYRKQMRDWEQRARVAQQGAELERTEFDMGQSVARGKREDEKFTMDKEAHAQRMAEAKGDKLVGQYAAKGGKQRFIFQRTDGSTYEKESEQEVAAKPDYASAEKTVTVGNRIKQFNPQTGRYDIDVGPAPADKGRGQTEAEFKVQLYRQDPATYAAVFGDKAAGAGTKELIQQRGQVANQLKDMALDQEIRAMLTEELKTIDEELRDRRAMPRGAKDATGGPATKPELPPGGVKPEGAKANSQDDIVTIRGRRARVIKRYPDGTADVEWLDDEQ